MSDLSPETEKLLALARGAGTLTDARRAQIKAGLMAQIAAGGAVGGVVSHALWGKAAWLSSPFVKGLSALALLSAVGVGVGVYIGARPHAAAPSVVVGTASNALSRVPYGHVAPQDPAGAAAVAPGAVNQLPDSPSSTDTSSASNPNGAPAEPSVAESDLAEPSVALPGAAHPSSASARSNASAQRTAAATPSSSAVAPSSDTLAEETRLLRDADQALRAGNAQHALALLDEDGARFPHGMLGPERAAERMIARCQLGQIDAKTAQMYLANHATSPFAARVADACHVSR